ncbi:hypothetical protein GUITHDRAFT_155071 [Guillardia theta CCMP2712]|uniref:Uncharacterized protein n=1 Tax=Guillardia theta (strain CCMP2712) TaxID=905079 RepID=L1IMP9_GUITC|nr:hypothetical protein GUITHDRAFT_155071 [Guillardia theta CCMP2712]EKX37085.1 hypothetical protein GUITHDRAFT_155071 [Guillardia theta CCMP2712]|eukprot:XP_005824065.1 hypothetical protein GUITHDRAFT_155071 [Guillardia theta CCMP2712]
MINDLLLPASILLLFSSLLFGIVIKKKTTKRKSALNPPSPSTALSPKIGDSSPKHVEFAPIQSKVHSTTILEELVLEQKRTRRQVPAVEMHRTRETSVSPERRSPTSSFSSGTSRYVAKSHLHRSSSGSRYYASIIARNFAVYDATLEEIEHGKEPGFAFQRIPSCPSYQSDHNVECVVKRVRSGGDM